MVRSIITVDNKILRKLYTNCIYEETANLEINIKPTFTSFLKK